MVVRRPRGLRPNKQPSCFPLGPVHLTWTDDHRLARLEKLSLPFNVNEEGSFLDFVCLGCRSMEVWCRSIDDCNREAFARCAVQLHDDLRWSVRRKVLDWPARELHPKLVNNALRIHPASFVWS